MSDVRYFVQFIHPGGEHTAPSGRINPWNRWPHPHRRKFIEIGGSYLENGRLVEVVLHFWGEWEPESEIVRRIARPVPEGPTGIHRPFWVAQQSYGGGVQL